MSLHRGHLAFLPKKAGLQTFLHFQTPSHPNGQWLMSGSLNGVHCCGTVGDSHSHSLLIATKRTFMGDSSWNHDAKIGLFLQMKAKIRNLFCSTLAFLYLCSNYDKDTA